MQNIFSIKKYLPRGYAKILAQKLNCSETMIYNCVNGLNRDTKIQTALIEMAENNISETENLLNRIENLTKKKRLLIE